MTVPYRLVMNLIWVQLVAIVLIASIYITQGVLQITNDVTFGSNQGIKIANSDNTKILIATGKTLTLNHEFIIAATERMY